MNPHDDDAAPTRPMESIKVENLLINFTTEFHRIWDNKGSRSKPGGFWRPSPAPDLLPGFFSLGDLAVSGHDNINNRRVVAVVCEGQPPSPGANQDKALSKPDDFEQVWKDKGSGAKTDCSIWRPVAPQGYVALGLVCADGLDKPSVNSVRCVRADLVVAASIDTMIWSDKGSRAKQDFSAWNVLPPAAAAGEIHFAPGTFVGVNSYTKPLTQITAYALRMRISLKAEPSPVPPSLTGYEPPASTQPATVTQTARLPWFAIKDPNLIAFEQFRTSPYYHLQRKEQYVLIGYGHNTSSAGKTFKWTDEAPTTESLETFSRLTSVEVGVEWSSRLPEFSISLPPTFSVEFSAKLGNSFSPTDTQNSRLVGPLAAHVVTIVAKKRIVAVYRTQFDYQLLRSNGTQVASEGSYSDYDKLHVSEYPPEQ
ncbi:Vps62-related protein [Pseudomonas sp. RA_35y_Pfl2_P32]|uniref:Vps62-related protein n=1 Tax=Pseudomonas sp. RA_35y_Pfl2_P32 TaxID=3088705 RepID=UPI0030D7B608